MKVAILTYARTNNYGATLQCYALNKYIRCLGYDTLILNVPLQDASRRKHDKSYVQRFFGFVQRILKRIFRCIAPTTRGTTFNDFEIRYQLSPEQSRKEREFSDLNMKLFDEFRAKYLFNLSREYFTLDELSEDYPDADVFVVGSDQVWNVNICQNQYPIFFLEFVKPNHKRIAYAACMGGDSNYIFTEKTKEHVKTLLGRFDHIAVRNEMGVKICQNNFGITPKQVMDPTFLIDNYDELLAETKQDATGCLFVDKFVINDIWMEIVRDIALRKRLNIRMDRCLIEIEGVPFNPICKVQDWLGILKTADMIFTDSFHCCVFCILFKKQFVVSPSYKGGEGRMVDLLRKLGLEDRFYRTPQELIANFDVWNMPIDYDSVFEKIEELRVVSQDFLKNALI
ncbi:MAG: polysaccharide pyruvyl transferase family protein [Bacteroidales bacterium]|nr:polysaccharide pyruvyl transferase family protein [Bacteroidales bacterium]